MEAIRTRRDLARHLQSQMVAARFSWPRTAEEEETTGRTSVKTYLLEAHQGDETDGDALLVKIAGAAGITVAQTDDPGLYLLRAGITDMWCDTSLGRFWRLHSIAPVDTTDRLRDQLVGATPFLDNVWLPPSYIESLPVRADASLLTFSLNHDRRLLAPSEAAKSEFAVTLRLWASHAGETLAKLRSADIFPQGVSLRSVRVRAEARDNDQDFCVAEYFNHGKVTASGTSFDQHTRLLVRVLEDYRALVERIEQTYGIGYDEEKGRLTGDPVVIPMEWTLDNLEYAVGRIFASVDPFRLWGTPWRVDEHHYRAHAVDLHIGETLTFDITPTHIVIQLPRGVCGNSVVRFIGSLDFHVNSDAGNMLLG